MTKKMVREYITMLVEMFTKVHLKMEKNKVMEY
jgi:hypothetical protein